MQNLKALFKFFLGLPLTLVSFYFIVRFVLVNGDQVLSHLENFNAIALTTGLLFLCVFFFLRSVVWNKLLEDSGYKFSQTQSMYLLSISEIKRYIPGSVLAFASRIHNFNSIKIPATQTAKLILYESILFVVTSIIVAIPSLFYFASKVPSSWTVYVVILLTITLTLGLVSAIIALSYPKRAKQFVNIVLNLKRFKVALLYMVIAWIFFGIGSFLVACAFNYLDPNNIISISSFFVLSWLIGYVVLIAPLGLGVREGAITYGLSFLMSPSIAATIAIIERLATVIAEVLFLATTFIFYKIIKFHKEIDIHATILWSAVTSYIFYFSYVSFEKYLNFFTGRFDLGNMDQTVWNTLHGRVFLLTNPDSTDTISRLSVHSDFILVLLSPFYLIWNDPRTLLFIQSAVLGIGAYFIYKLAVNVVGDKNVSLALSIGYLLNPLVQKQNLFDFHAVTLATTFLLASFYFATVKKYSSFLYF